MIRKYYLEGYAIKFLSLLLVCFTSLVGLIYLFFYVPLFMIDDYFQVIAITALIGVVFLISTFLVTPLEYRLDRKYGRTTFGFRRYLGYKLRSRLVFLMPFAMLLLLFVAFWLFAPSDADYSQLLTFATTLAMVLIIGLAMPKIYGSILKKEKIEDQGLLDSIRELADKMGIKGKFTGAYHVPVEGFKVVNAAQLGFSRRQARVYLIGDIEKVLNKKEIEAVVAHEFAHLRLRHILKLTAILIALMLGLYSVFTVAASLLVYFLIGTGIIVTDEMVFFILIVMDYLVPFVFLYLLLLKLRRMFENEADLLAARCTNPMDLATSLEKLADYNLVPMKFPKIIGILKGHPSMFERIERLKRMNSP